MGVRMLRSWKVPGSRGGDERLLICLLIVSATFGMGLYAVVDFFDLNVFNGLILAAFYGALGGISLFFLGKLILHYTIARFLEAARSVASPISLLPNPPRWKQGELSLLNSVFEITLRQITETERRRLAQAEDTNARLRKANSTLELLHAASTAIIDSDRLETMIQQVIAIIVDHFGALGGAVRIAEGVSPGRFVVPATDLTEEQERMLASLEAHWSEPCRLVIRGGAMTTVPIPNALSLAAEPVAADIGIAVGHTWSIPLETQPNNAPLGVLVLFFDPPEILDDTARSALLPIARHLGAAVLNALHHDQTRRQAVTDPLTGLYNRRVLDHWLNTEILLAQKADTPIALLMVDLDRFKEINDNYGHLVGDQVLARASAMLQESIRTDDIVIRFGGEEFAVLLRNAGLDQAAEVAERIRSRIALTDWSLLGINDHSLTVSIGAISYRGTIGDPNVLIAAADRLLYKAKQNGKNCVTFASDLADVVGLGHNAQTILTD